jgi:hypothetical protein
LQPAAAASAAHTGQASVTVISIATRLLTAAEIAQKNAALQALQVTAWQEETVLQQQQQQLLRLLLAVQLHKLLLLA